MAREFKNGTPDRPQRGCGKTDVEQLTSIACRRVRALREDEELSLAHKRAPLSRLSLAARRAGRRRFFAITDTIAERARKIGGTTIRSISDVARNQRLKDNNNEGVSPQEMISELCEDNEQLDAKACRAAHEVCNRHNDVATARLIEVWIDESERRTWFLAEITRDA